LIYAGLKAGVDETVLRRELDRGTCETCFHAFEPSEGDCIFLPAGTVHAIGAGLLICELQQASDCTYRLFDWNRLGPDGKSRPLHIEPALEAVDFSAGPVAPQKPIPTGEPGISRLVTCDKFLLDRWTFDSPRKLALENSCRLLVVLEGGFSIPGDPTGHSFGKGDTVFLPSALGQVELHPQQRTILLSGQLP
jgi:mannose-6-phosphate isomerase